MGHLVWRIEKANCNEVKMLVLVGCYWSLPLSYDPDVWHLYDTYITKVLMPVVLNVFALWTADSFLQAGFRIWVTSPTSAGNLSPAKANSSDGEELQAMENSDLEIHPFSPLYCWLWGQRVLGRWGHCGAWWTNSAGWKRIGGFPWQPHGPHDTQTQVDEEMDDTIMSFREWKRNGRPA